MVRELVFAVVLLIAAGLVTTGAYIAATSAGFIVGGLLLAGWCWLILAEGDE